VADEPNEQGEPRDIAAAGDSQVGGRLALRSLSTLIRGCFHVLIVKGMECNGMGANELIH
jgi:hypothetical protein